MQDMELDEHKFIGGAIIPVSGDNLTNSRVEERLRDMHRLTL